MCIYIYIRIFELSISKNADTFARLISRCATTTYAVALLSSRCANKLVHLHC